MRACLLLIAALIPLSSLAQDWQEQWKRTVAAAEKEGALVMNSQPNRNAREFLQREWEKAYPKIALSSTVVPTPQFISRIKTERATGRYLWDFAIAGSNTAYILSRDGIVDPLAPEFMLPDIRDPETWGGWDRVFVDRERKYAFAITGFLKSPFYNAQRIPPEKVKEMGLRILLDPAYKERIVWHDPSLPGSGQSFAYVLRSRLGDEGLKRLIVDQKVRIVKGQNEVVEAIARGTAWIGIGPIIEPLLEPYEKAGLKLDVRPFGNAPEVNEMSMGGAGLYVFNRRPHPNATRVFVNWLLSKDVQTAFARTMEQDTRRVDVPAVSPPDRAPLKGARYIETQREELTEQVNAAGKLVEQLRELAK